MHSVMLVFASFLKSAQNTTFLLMEYRSIPVYLLLSVVTG